MRFSSAASMAAPRGVHHHLQVRIEVGSRRHHGPEVKGRCQHPIVAGSGTGGFAGATGRFDFKDVISDGSIVYRGHITL